MQSTPSGSKIRDRAWTRLADGLRRATASFVARRARRSVRAVCLVFVYHGVTTQPESPHYLSPQIDLPTLRSHLAYLRASYEVVPIAELAEQARRRPLAGRHPVAITFDDDLRSHATLAAPLLQEMGLPAAFFLTGRSLDSPFRCWWHDLEALADRGPEGWHEAKRRLAEGWPWASPGDSLRELALTIEGLPAPERADVGAALRELAGSSTYDPGLSSASIRTLATQGFEIGFHTLRHDRLDTVRESELPERLRSGLDELASAAGQTPRAIAYPHGWADLRIARAAAGAGFELGFTATGGPVHASDNPLLLDRLDAVWGGVKPRTRGNFALVAARTISTGP